MYVRYNLWAYGFFDGELLIELSDGETELKLEREFRFSRICPGSERALLRVGSPTPRILLSVLKSPTNEL